MGRLIDLAEQRFGRWLVIHRAQHRSGNRNALWFCRCDCGEARVVRGDTLRRGISTSCGCAPQQWDEERREKQRKRCTTHGMSKTRTYRIWKGMLQRCFNENC